MGWNGLVATGAALGVATVLMIGNPPGARAQGAAAPPPRSMGFLDMVLDSLTGDVYAPGRWRELPLGTFFSEGWDEPWAGGPNGDGGAPRQGWLGAQDGVFYRLAIATFGYAHELGGDADVAPLDGLGGGGRRDDGDNYTGALQIYTPINRRFQLRWDIPIMTANRAYVSNDDYQFGAPDFALTPRFMLQESENVSQSLDITFRMPTGDTLNGNGIAAVTPMYNFWVNAWQGLVIRGGTGFFVPYGDQSLNEVGSRNAFLGNLALGYYFTPHDWAPIGDLVWYVAGNLQTLIDHRGASNTTTLTITPGFRTHLGANWYLLGATEVPVTNPEPFDYQVLAGLMKVW